MTGASAAILEPGAESSARRLRIRVRGTVQGVGFRPFLHRLAARHSLAGFVRNDPDGVIAEIEGRALDGFLAALVSEQPLLARVDTIEVTAMPCDGAVGFAIQDSTNAPGGRAAISPDTAPCPACLADIVDSASRFYLYPFVSCTDCGPRFTIVNRQPYDRAFTSMAGFPLCADCARDYHDPASRRFHAQAIACPACGPTLDHDMATIAAALLAGKIVALKSVGGFHLLCDAENEASVAELRRRKNRPSKPFAVMAATIASAALITTPDEDERALLLSAVRPIVLIRKCDGAANRVAVSVAPEIDRIGIMLPSAPLHHVLFGMLQRSRNSILLVATSANLDGDPCITDDGDARRQLVGIADLIVTHDRPILARADDSVMHVVDHAPAFIRRARGFVPDPIDLGQDGPCVLATGAHLKATLCVTRGRLAFMSTHIGDLRTATARRAYGDTARRMLASLGVTPELVVCDQHPDYASSRFAQSYATDVGAPVLRVQHHAAHVGAVTAEHGLCFPVLGVALDGTGQGTDSEGTGGGTSWGGEMILLDGAVWRRIGHLAPLALLGGDLAATQPWRMGVAALVALGRGDEAASRFPTMKLAAKLALLADAQPGTTTTSMGRLFDAAAALLGVCTNQSYEGEAAMRLEAMAGLTLFSQPGGYRIIGENLDFRPLLSTLLQSGPRPTELDARHGAALFHGTIIAGLAEWIGRAADRYNTRQVALGGGCLANAILADGLTAALRAIGITPYLPRAVPANDAGLSLGQAAMGRAHLAAAQLAAEG